MICIKTSVSEINKKVISCNLLDDIFYEELISKSNVLKSTIKKGSNTFKSFSLLTNDVFSLLYKVVVTFNDDNDISTSSFQHKPIVEYLYNSTILNKLRSRTIASLPNTAISIKYILDELITKLRGSDKSKIIKKEQDKLSNLLNKKKDIQNILNSIQSNKKYKIPIKSTENINFPFNNKVESILKEILKSALIKDENYNSISLLEDIINKSQEIISNNGVANSYDKTKENKFNKSVSNAINEYNENFNDNNYTNENILESFLNKVNDQFNNQNEHSNNSKNKIKEDNIEENNINVDENLKDNDAHSDEISSKILKETIAYTKEKISNYKKTNFKIIKKMFSNLSMPNINIDTIDEDLDNIIIIDNKENENKNTTNEFTIYHQINNNNLIESYYDKFKNIHKIEQADNFIKLIDFISSELKSIDNKIEISRRSIKKQMENLNLNKVIEQSIDNLIEFDNNIKLLNVNNKSISNLTFDEIIDISKYFNTPDIKMFFDKVGRKKEIVRKASYKKKKDKAIVSDKILLSDDIDNLIDEELLTFSIDIEAFEKGFYDRYLHSRLLTYEKVKSKEKNKGPIILCYDGSGSMEGNKIKETKIHIISFIEIARLQKRKMITIQFASKDEPLIIKELNPNNIKINDIYDIMDNFLRGGTDFEKPLAKAINFIKADNFKHSDILFITDGVCSISDDFKKKFISVKKIMKFKLYSVIMHGNTYSDYGDLGDISDEIMEIRNMNLNNWNEKISEKIFSI